jgi:hypothetical protein
MRIFRMIIFFGKRKTKFDRRIITRLFSMTVENFGLTRVKLKLLAKIEPILKKQCLFVS